MDEPTAPARDADDLTSERYVPDAHRGYTIEAEHEARYRWISPLAAGARVLDAGCGTGFGIEVLRSHQPASIHGFDLNRVAVHDARRRTNGRVSVVEGDLTAIPFADGGFDLVTCFEAIEHVADAERGLDELSRVLAPGGVLAISTPSRGVYAEGNPYHLHEFSSAEFEAALKARFSHVAVWHQETHAATLIADDAGFELADPGAILAAEVRKIWGAPVGSELYMVALASDRELPELRPLAVLGRALDYWAVVADLGEWKERAILASADAAATRGERDWAAYFQREAVQAGPRPRRSSMGHSEGCTGSSSLAHGGGWAGCAPSETGSAPSLIGCGPSLPERGDVSARSSV